MATRTLDKVLQSAARAAVPIARKLEEGLQVEKVDDFTYRLRLAMCNSCEHLTEKRACGKCHCPVDYKASLKHDPYLAAFKKVLVTCPVGAW